MKFYNDIRFSIKTILSKPLESFLLIIGIALGIGAVSAGLSLFLQIQFKKIETGNSLKYREIVVSPGNQVSSMDTAASLETMKQDFSFSESDFLVQKEVPEIQHSYLKIRSDIYFFDDSIITMDNATIMSSEGMEGNVGTSFVEAVPGFSENPDIDGLELQDFPTGDMSAENGFPDFAGLEDVLNFDGPKPVVTYIPAYKVSPGFFEAWVLTAKKGSMFTKQEVEAGKKVVVLGASIAEKLFEDGVALGRSILVGFELYTIVCILDKTKSNIDDEAFYPVSSGRSDMIFMMGGTIEQSLNFIIKDSASLKAAEQNIRAWFDNKYGQKSVTVVSKRKEVFSLINKDQSIAVLILFIAVAGFIIALINVSNILISKTMKQYKNIGILKALGAAKRDIFKIFYFEAILLSSSGAVLGFFLSLLFRSLITKHTYESYFSALAIILGILISYLITIGLTMAPAVMASRISASEAIRNE